MALRTMGSQFAELLGSKRITLLRGEARLKQRWREVVGPMVAARTRPLELELLADGSCCLWVAVDHPYMAQQLRLMRDALRRACLQQCGIRRIAKIRSRVDPNVAGCVPPIQEKARRAVGWRECRAAVAEMRAVRDRGLRHRMIHARLRQIENGFAEENHAGQ